MRALAAVLILAACLLRCHAHDDDGTPASRRRDTVPHRLLSVIGVSLRSPLQRIVECSQSIGPSKCLAALSIWRAEKAASVFQRRESNDFSLLDDIRQFPWEQYMNHTQDELDGQLCEGTDKLLQYRTLKFKMLPGYELELASNGNGTLNVDILHGQQPALSRGMKNTFYNIVPYLLLPGLLMSAVLPFVLPALKMMTLAVGMLNNMALSGAVFTLLRNNAFNDRYDKKVIYVNKGYRNDEPAHYQLETHYPEEDIFVDEYENQNNHDNLQGYESTQVHNIIVPENANAVDYSAVQETPVAVLNSDWINQYYGNKNNKIVTYARKRHGKENIRPKTILNIEK
ncbi:hypothetical protein evm_002781 [Chilo suppressalis]|nr:hypothetical protein evm_002781 [Chilo suppressalis]